MKVEYCVESNGTLKVRDERGRTVILNDAYWHIRTVPPNDKYNFFYGFSSGGCTTEIPEGLFTELFYGIRRYHKRGSNDIKLRNHIEALELNLIDILKRDGQVNLDSYLFNHLLVNEFSLPAFFLKENISLI